MDDLRTRILRAATRLFACKGYGSATMRMIVDEVGVTKPTVYYYFANKDALFLEAVHAQVEGLRNFINATLRAQELPPLERIRSFAQGYVAYALEDRDGVLLMMTAQHPTHDGQPVVDLLSVHQETLLALAEALSAARELGQLRPGLDDTLGAVGLVGALNLYVVAVLHGLPPTEGAADRLLDQFFHGVSV